MLDVSEPPEVVFINIHVATGISGLGGDQYVKSNVLASTKTLRHHVP